MFTMNQTKGRKAIHPIKYANVMKVVDFIQKMIEEPATRIRRKCN